MSDLKKAHCISRLNFEHVHQDCEDTSVSAPEHKSRIMFEEAYVAEGEVTFYFTGDAALFQELMGREEPGATGTTLSVSCPTAYVGSEYASVQISPSLRTVVDGKESVADYDWSDINLPYEDIDWLITQALLASR